MTSQADIQADSQGKGWEELLAAQQEKAQEVVLPAPLSPSQARALAALQAGKNVFLTGVAGTGKSFVLRRFIEEPGKHPVRGEKVVAVCATTGIAALAIDGCTVHRWAGVGIGENTLEEIVIRPGWRDYVATRIWRATTLIVDEISMASAKILDLIDGVCREARLGSSHLPFGGLQVVLVGDLGQLPPVDKADRHRKGQSQEPLFPFESGAWKALEAAGLTVCRLLEPQRQHDAQFIGLLNRARLGVLSVDDERTLLARRIPHDPTRPPVFVVTTNAQAAEANERGLESCDPLTERVYEADIYTEHDGLVDQVVRDCPSPEFLRLRIGARVICTHNNSDRYVNGSLGTVVELEEFHILVLLDRPITENPIRVSKHTWKLTERDAYGNKKVLAEMEQFPLKLSYALTVHRTQGMTLDQVSLDLSRTFAPGQAYVALSRVRSLDGLYLTGWPGRRKVSMHPKVRAWCLKNEGMGGLMEGCV